MLKTNQNRLWRSLMDMAAIGSTSKGGSCRLALSDEDKAGRDLFIQWCESAGCTYQVDDMGNIFVRRSGEDDNMPAIAMGSHLDTQPHGGKFDGVYGVLAGLEVIRCLNDRAIKTRAPVEVVVWTNEEGSRFAPAMLASAVFAGVFDRDYGRSRQDSDGKTVAEELARIGYDGEMPCGQHRFGGFFEAHIEQGPILERENKTIGVVEGGQGARWYDVSVAGQDAHAGSTPMAGRRDALVYASQVIGDLNKLARENGPNSVATVGQLSVSPNSRNTIPGRVDFSVDIRHHDAAVLESLDAMFRQRSAALCDAPGIELSIEQIWYQPPVAFDATCIEAVRSAAGALGYRHQSIFSGAGHDACLISKVAPTAMIFVPCEGGISHNEAESASAEDLTAGCDVLLNVVIEQAGIASNVEV